MNAAEYLTRYLVSRGVSCIFGIPGVHTLELYRALQHVPMRHIAPRHEQSAGFMADGYARRSGRPGVCFIISGPGMTNMLTAMGQAYGDSIPMLVISTVNAHGRMGSGNGWLHELPDQQAMMRGVCEFSHTVHEAAELPQVLARAFAVFEGTRPRPVHIELPLNVLAAPCAASLPRYRAALARPGVNPEAAISAATLLRSADRPLMLAGGGAIGASMPIRQLAERLGAPVVMSVNARGILSAEHPLAIGASASLPAVRRLIAEADVILAIGTELGSTDYDFNEDGGFEIPGQLIRIDIDAQQLMRTRVPELPLLGDAAQGVSALLKILSSDAQSAEDITVGSADAHRCREQVLASLSTTEHRYLQLLHTIRDSSEAVTIVGDSTQIIYTGNSAFAAGAPQRYFNSATGFGTLGYALSAAIGAALADPVESVVAIIGDGGLQFCIAELATAVDAGINITLIVHHNGGYAEIARFMAERDIKPVGVDLLVPDMEAVAIACGWQARSLDSLENLATELADTYAAVQPTLLLIHDELFTQ